MDVFVVQHAEKGAGGADPGVTWRGRLQAARAADALASRCLSLVWTSPLRRALESARIIGDALAVSVATDSRLTERMNWGGDQECSIQQFLEEWRRTVADRDYVPPTGDSSRAAGARFAGFLTAIAKTGRRASAVVSHGGVTVDLLRTLLGDDELDRRSPGLIDGGVPGCAITSLSVEPGEIQVVDIASIEHLPEAVRSGHRA